MYKETIRKYVPVNEQEINDKKLIMQFIEKNDDILNRDNLTAHLTTSTIVVNESLDKVVFAYHLIYKSWSWIGGHNDDNPNCLEVALKETTEETGLKNIRPYINEPIMIDVINVQNHIKNGNYVSDHLHLNLTYLIIADESEKLKIRPNENSDVKWFDLNKMTEISTEERMVPIYKKAYNYIENIKIQNK